MLMLWVETITCKRCPYVNLPLKVKSSTSKQNPGISTKTVRDTIKLIFINAAKKYKIRHDTNLALRAGKIGSAVGKLYPLALIHCM